MKSRSLKLITDWVASRLASAPIEQQIALYEALSEVLPDKEERAKAMEIAVTLSEIAKLQLDFTRTLFTSIAKAESGDGHKS